MVARDLLGFGLLAFQLKLRLRNREFAEGADGMNYSDAELGLFMDPLRERASVSAVQDGEEVGAGEVGEGCLKLVGRDLGAFVRELLEDRNGIHGSHGNNGLNGFLNAVAVLGVQNRTGVFRILL